MKEVNNITVLTNDYIYIPFNNREDLNINSNGYIYKNDIINKDIKNIIISPISGKAYGVSTIKTQNNVVDVLVIENDYLENLSKPIISIKDIYDIKKQELKEHLKEFSNTKDITLSIESDNNDYKDIFILQDYLNEILETLNIISITYDIKISIVLNKKDIISYKNLFTYIGTYPNIEISFKKENDSKYVNLYDIIDLYNKIKNNQVRDYIYFTLIHKKKVYVIKTKKYSNISDVVKTLNINYNEMIINKIIKSKDINLLLDENIKVVNVM